MAGSMFVGGGEGGCVCVYHGLFFGSHTSWMVSSVHIVNPQRSFLVPAGNQTWQWKLPGNWRLYIIMEIHLLVFIGQSHMHDSYMRDFPLPFACQRVKTISIHFQLMFIFSRFCKGYPFVSFPTSSPSLGWFKGKSTGNIMVFTIKYRAFL